MTVNRRVLQRLLDDIERFESGGMSLPSLQSAILGHGHAVELGQAWHDLVNHVEGEIEMAVVTEPAPGHLPAIQFALDRLRAAARQAMDAEPDVPE